VTLPVDPEAVAVLADARNREAVGRLVSRVLRPRSGPSPLAEIKPDARGAGLTATSTPSSRPTTRSAATAAPSIDRLRRRSLH
jgi:hypothetical protein